MQKRRCASQAFDLEKTHSGKVVESAVPGGGVGRGREFPRGDSPLLRWGQRALQQFVEGVSLKTG